jgi:hypothetical protein
MLRRNMSPNADEHPAGLVETPQPSAPVQVFRSKVYRAGETHDWVVEPPRDQVAAVGKMVFTGPKAQQLALTYAYETYGNARFFPY